MTSRGFSVWWFSDWIKNPRFFSSFLAGMMMDTSDEPLFGLPDFLGLGIFHKKTKPRSQKKKRRKGMIVFMNACDEIAIDSATHGQHKARHSPLLFINIDRDSWQW
jgi:hypothetical protein